MKQRNALPSKTVRIKLVQHSQDQVYEFSESVMIGRHLSCDIVIEEEGVSRHHLSIYPDAEQWIAVDAGSANGVYYQGSAIKQIVLEDLSLFTLGIDGPAIEVKLVDATDTKPDTVQEHGRGGNTKMQKACSTTNLMILSSIFMIIISALSLVIFQQRQVIGTSNDVFDELFYEIKSLQLLIAKTDANVRKSGSVTGAANIRNHQQQVKSMRERYRSYLNELSHTDDQLSAREKLIMKVAGDFGESELELPADFVDEVNVYIEKWQASNRLSNVINRLNKSGDLTLVLDVLRDYGLPEQFIYLPLQESNYNHKAVGPQTYAGYAKGAWQFIPSTATEYGLKTGPLAAVDKYDIEDERFDFEKSTKAAIAYIYDIYSTEAQASGLLVLASYNWGHDKVRKLVANLPDNPRERNFWKLIKDYKIPDETYDYVLMIFSAAVIGEDPQLFGFEFERPIS